MLVSPSSWWIKSIVLIILGSSLVVHSFSTNFKRRFVNVLESNNNNIDSVAKSPRNIAENKLKLICNFINLATTSVLVIGSKSIAEEVIEAPTGITSNKIDFRDLRVPYNHVNYPLKDFLGKKATIVFNMKIDDPQTVLQFPDLQEIYKKYSEKGLNVLAFPTEQGWFEPDDDETVRAKAKESLGFGDYPHAVVFDKVDNHQCTNNTF